MLRIINFTKILHIPVLILMTTLATNANASLAGSFNIHLSNHSTDTIALNGIADPGAYWAYRYGYDWHEDVKAAWITDNKLIPRHSCDDARFNTFTGNIHLAFKNGDSVIINLQNTYDCQYRNSINTSVQTIPANSRCHIVIKPVEYNGVIPVDVECL